MSASFVHETVLRDEAVAALSPRDGGIYVDCTLGGGGHSEALLRAADCRVIGVDRDPAALDAARARLAAFGGRFQAARSTFSELDAVLDALGIGQVDGILADLGVSSPQLDRAERGFSFRNGGPVDMRMDPDAPLSAATIVNEWPEEEIARVIRDYGEERRWRPVARAIVAGRPWSDTRALADTIASVVGRGEGRIHPATRAFQGLRIATNDELGELERLLPAATARLLPGGTLAIITFHSLEDRLVKQFFARESGQTADRDPYGHRIGSFRLLPPSRPLTPHPTDPNPRARSARLRASRRLG